MKIYIVNCTLPYLFRGINVSLLNTNASLSLCQRVKNRFATSPFVPENMEAYKQLEDADVVILFGDTKCFISRCLHIQQHVPSEAMLHLYLWNPISYYQDDFRLLDHRWTVWSFAKEEAEKNHLRYAETFYNKKLVVPADIQTDLFFVGLGKNRVGQILQIQEIASAQRLNADINIVDNLKRLYNSRYVKRMGYEEVRMRVARTKALIDIMQSGQSGMTQRVMEALFFKKKLVTNNAFVKKCRFYTPENVFIIGEDKWENLSEFVSTPCSDISGFDMTIYDVENWLQRIIQKEDFHE